MSESPSASKRAKQNDLCCASITRCSRGRGARVAKLKPWEVSDERWGAPVHPHIAIAQDPYGGLHQPARRRPLQRRAWAGSPCSRNDSTTSRWSRTRTCWPRRTCTCLLPVAGRAVIETWTGGRWSRHTWAPGRLELGIPDRPALHRYRADGALRSVQVHFPRSTVSVPFGSDPRLAGLRPRI